MTTQCDLLIIGGGPAGFAAAINGASEGLHCILIDSGPKAGGQAVNSSLIENYPGFPEGVSGEDLMTKFISQASKFKTDVRCPEKAIGLKADGTNRIVLNEEGEEYCARVVILGAGLSYRRLNADGMGRLMGKGVLYGAPTHDPTGMGDCDVLIVGGANSAGQAAMHMSKNPRARIKMLIRKTLESQMSTYLVDRIRACRNIEVVEGVEVIKVDGETRLETVTVRAGDGSLSEVRANHLFIFIGASPKTLWLSGSVEFDERKFIITGNDLVTQRLWTQERLPFDYETSLPGVFAAGDVRLGSTKRIAGAAGEGAAALQACHNYLRTVRG